MLDYNERSGRDEGSAEIILTLEDSKITMTHADGTILRRWDAKSGDWARMVNNVRKTFQEGKKKLPCKHRKFCLR